MAVPRVFISSTCYDLSEVRDRLVSFCELFGFETVLSDRGDVFYHPDLHTHESCINEISNCQLFILIIGGRFGGKYKVDQDKSITNAEFIAAKELGLPVFSFIKEGVLSDHNIYQKNKGEEFVTKIVYPSIERQEYAQNIFAFIDEVRLSDTNNGFFGFLYAKDIEHYLRKQLAGMFFDFLSKRNISAQLRSTNEAVQSLTVASNKIEQLVKTIYRHVDESRADEVIDSIEEMSRATEFFKHISDRINSDEFIDDVSGLSESPPVDWQDFLLRNSGFVYETGLQDDDGRETDIIGHEPTRKIISEIDGDMTKKEVAILRKLEKNYASFCNLSVEKRRELLSNYAKSP